MDLYLKYLFMTLVNKFNRGLQGRRLLPQLRLRLREHVGQAQQLHEVKSKRLLSTYSTLAAMHRSSMRPRMRGGAGRPRGSRRTNVQGFSRP